MALTMHAASVPPLLRTFGAMLNWLDKAEAHAKARGFSPDAYLALRFAPDMLPFTKQIQIASDMAKGCVARLAGVDVPAWADDETTLDALRERIRRTMAYVEGFGSERLDGSETREIALPTRSGEPRRFSGQAYLTDFVLPNVYFHATTAYALLRQAGVELGKKDFLNL